MSETETSETFLKSAVSSKSFQKNRLKPTSNKRMSARVPSSRLFVTFTSSCTFGLVAGTHEQIALKSARTTQRNAIVLEECGLFKISPKQSTRKPTSSERGRRAYLSISQVANFTNSVQAPSLDS